MTPTDPKQTVADFLGGRLAAVMIQERRRSAVILLALLLTAQAYPSDDSFQVAESCKSGESASKWPSFAEGVVCTFIRDKDDLQALQSLMAEVRFSNVVRLGEERVIGYNSTSDGKTTAPEAPPDSDRWSDLMNKTQTQVLKRSENATIFTTVPVESPSDRVDMLSYHTGDLPEAKKCVAQFRNVPCGICDLSRLDGWTIRYVWSSGPHIEEFFRGHTQTRDHFDKFHKENFECLRRGLKEMEYENPADFF